jgi:hypothetical protein
MDLNIPYWMFCVGVGFVISYTEETLLMKIWGFVVGTVFAPLFIGMYIMGFLNNNTNK